MSTRCCCVLLSIVMLPIGLGGCVSNESIEQSQPFDSHEVDACLAIIVDMSGSFAQSWADRAYALFLDLMDRFFTEGTGVESRIVIAN